MPLQMAPNRTIFYRLATGAAGRSIAMLVVVSYLCFLLSVGSGGEGAWARKDVGAGTTAVYTETETETVTRVVTRTVERMAPQATVTRVVTKEVVVPRARRKLLKGPPTAAFKDNLLPEVQYLTSWTGSGFTNDVMTFINLIYLGVLTERVPIVPHFIPTHVMKSVAHTGPGIDFGDVFDLERYYELTGQAVLDWRQVKDPESKTVDPLGCWNVWEPVNPKVNQGPHWTPSPHRLKLDVSYSNAPGWIKRSPNSEDDLHTQFTALMALGFPTMRNRFLTAAELSPILQERHSPDEHLLCFDNLYWACDLEGHEMEQDWSAAWRLVGQHLHWTKKIEGLANEYLRDAFKLGPKDPVPYFIAIHARRGDFGANPHACNNLPRDECLAPLSAYDRRVKQMQAKLKADKGLDVTHVLLTSDELDPEWWATALRTYDWARADHALLETRKKHGVWYPILIDAALQSHPRAMGVVGTFSSTVSVVAGKRVVSWNGGVPHVLVRWGRWGPDAEYEQ
ncbi:hypothetical protein MKEN_00840700 [Mycena kentingensis (nom. inval.)]|nr:hypothetical protein MKEN_00840700 [Mycena kentingensis (nom. inval.)]